MATLSLTSPISGSAQTGFTSPSLTLTLDTSPNGQYGRQHAVTAVSGMPSATVHSIASPFTINFIRPSTLKALQAVAGQLTLVGRVPRNVWKRVTRKGMLVLANQPYQLGYDRHEVDLPAGADTSDPANVRAMISASIGADVQLSAAWGDTVTSGVW